MSRLQEITKNIIPKLVDSGKIGAKVKYLSCTFESCVEGEAQFASTVFRVVGVFKDKEIMKIPLLVKVNIENHLVRSWLGLDEQFRNEVIAYEKVLPMLDRDDIINDIFPKFYYGSTESSDSANYSIVLENLSSSGFTMSKEILNLDFVHCALAFKKLGVFHALSFAAKKYNAKQFFEVTQRLVDTRLGEDRWENDDCLFSGSVGRAATPLLERGEKLDEIKQFQDKIINSLEYFRYLFEVKEPMGVITHGDFCRNNVLYKYNNKDEPVAIKFFDLAHARYASPMLDFSFFFLLNCSEDSRKLHMEDYLQIYHDALSSSVPGVEVPTLDDFREEFRLKAVYGFLHCSFFKPAMMSLTPFNPEEAVRQPVSERKALILSNGGPEATVVISNMLSELIGLKCVF